MGIINRFREEYFFLSNFCPCRINYNGRNYLCAEAAVQAEKTLDSEEKDLFKFLNGADSKALGKTISLRSDWEDIRLDVMYNVLLCKFNQNDILREKLLSTEDSILIEGNDHGDTFWGVCKDNGSNYLGQLLMLIRKEILDGVKPEFYKYGGYNDNSDKLNDVLEISFSGHRPNRPTMYGYDYNSRGNLKIKELTLIQILTVLAERNPKKVIFRCGGALGFDSMAFDVCQSIKRNVKDSEIIVEMCIPFEKQSEKWPEYSKEYYEYQKSLADNRVLVDTIDSYKISPDEIPGEYNINKLKKRNKYLADNCQILISCCDNKPSGTLQCVEYARKNNRIVINIDPTKI